MNIDPVEHADENAIGHVITGERDERGLSINQLADRNRIASCVRSSTQ